MVSKSLWVGVIPRAIIKPLKVIDLVWQLKSFPPLQVISFIVI